MPAPTITSVTPNSGPSSGGTSVTINGSGFTGATQVSFGSAPATGVTISGDGQIIALSPAGSSTVNVSVTTPSGTSTIGSGSQFLYTTASSSGTASMPSTPSAAAVSSSGYYVDPGLSSQFVASLLNVVQSATSPDVLEAQNIILRRLALEGDVVPSRMPPPKNITEIGGYINLLSLLSETAMREQVLAGVLGVAGPTQPLGWITNTTPLGMTSITNDRPTGGSQAAIPLTVLVRSDFVAGVQAAMKTVHQYGATMPLTGPPVLVLPRGTPGVPVPSDVLLYLGRTLSIAPAAALNNPQSDPIALIRPAGTTQSFQIAANVLSATSTPVPPADYDSLQCTTTNNSIVALTGISFVPLAPILANAGFYPASPLPVPQNNTQISWARFSNITGFIVGNTKLGDELSLLYRPDIISDSVFASMLNWVWNGKTFASN